MTTANFSIKQGNTWNPSIAIEEDGVAKNCSNLLCKMVIKKGLEEALEATETIDISWVSQAGGTGTFLLTQAKSKALELGTYYYEVFLYNAAGTYNESISQGELVIAYTLDKDLQAVA